MPHPSMLTKFKLNRNSNSWKSYTDNIIRIFVYLVKFFSQFGERNLKNGEQLVVTQSYIIFFIKKNNVAI